MLSKRAVPAIGELRGQFDWLKDDAATDVVTDGMGQSWWWTFAGTNANAELARRLGDLATSVSTNGLAVRVVDGLPSSELKEAVRAGGDDAALPNVAEVEEVWKFSDALPVPTLVRLLDARLRDHEDVTHAMASPIRAHRVLEVAPRP